MSVLTAAKKVAAALEQQAIGACTTLCDLGMAAVDRVMASSEAGSTDVAATDIVNGGQTAAVGGHCC